MTTYVFSHDPNEKRTDDAPLYKLRLDPVRSSRVTGWQPICVSDDECKFRGRTHPKKVGARREADSHIADHMRGKINKTGVALKNKAKQAKQEPVNLGMNYMVSPDARRTMLSAMTREELRGLAAQVQLKGRASMNKAQLVDALVEAGTKDAKAIA